LSIPGAKQLVESFCPESDIATLFSVVCQLLLTPNHEQMIENCRMAGISMIEFLSFRSHLSEIVGGDLQSKVAQMMEKWLSRIRYSVLSLIDLLFLAIKSLNNGWLEVREMKLVGVCGLDSAPAIICEYPLDQKVVINARPGWNGLICPGNFYAIRLVAGQTSDLISGSLIHQVFSPHESFIGIQTVRVQPFSNSSIFSAIFHSYLGSDISQLNQMSLADPQNFPGNEHQSFYLSPDNCINFWPKTPAIEGKCRRAIPRIEALMPFIPRSVLFELRLPVCVIEISSLSSTDNRTKVHLLIEGEHRPYAYHITKSLIIELQQKLGDLASVTMPIRFAITGECFSFVIHDDPSDTPNLVQPDCLIDRDAVFTGSPSHLIVLSDSPLSDKCSLIKTWSSRTKSKHETEEMVQIINQVVPGRISAQCVNDMYIIEFNGCTYDVSRGELNYCVATYLREKGIKGLGTFQTLVSA
jgi:hypothetical protein